jgi:hypothetical protein
MKLVDGTRGPLVHSLLDEWDEYMMEGIHLDLSE